MQKFTKLVKRCEKVESMWESEGPLRLGGQLGGWGLIGCITIVMRLSSIMLLGCRGLRSLGREGEGAQGRAGPW